jgi:hypothetical protein
MGVDLANYVGYIWSVRSAGSSRMLVYAARPDLK